MKWMEMIRLMSSAGGHAEAIEAVTNPLKEIESTLSDVEAFLLQHALYDGDVAAVLVWRNERFPVRTREGLLIAETLQRYGTVDHAVWRAAPGFEEKTACTPRESFGGGGGR